MRYVKTHSGASLQYKIPTANSRKDKISLSDPEAPMLRSGTSVRNDKIRFAFYLPGVNYYRKKTFPPKRCDKLWRLLIDNAQSTTVSRRVADQPMRMAQQSSPSRCFGIVFMAVLHFQSSVVNRPSSVFHFRRTLHRHLCNIAGLRIE